MRPVEELDIDWLDFDWPGFVATEYRLPMPFGQYDCQCCLDHKHRVKSKKHWLFRRDQWEDWHNQQEWAYDAVCHTCCMFRYTPFDGHTVPRASMGDPRVPTSFQPIVNLGVRKVRGPMSCTESSYWTKRIMQPQTMQPGFKVEEFTVALWLTACWPRWEAQGLGQRQTMAFNCLHHLWEYGKDGQYRSLFPTMGIRLRRWNQNKNAVSMKTNYDKG